MLAILLWGVSLDAAAQSVTGTTSLIRIPTAEMPADGQVRFTTGFVHRDYNDRSERDVVQYGTSMAFLPFLELGFRFNKQLSARDALGDRMIALRVRILNERAALPAIVVGAHDFIRSTVSLTTRYHALYAVASKSARLTGTGVQLEVATHAGYATDVIEARGYELRGVFGGMSVTPVRQADVLVEYDSRTVNGGVRVRVLRFAEVLAGLQGFDRFTGGIALSVQL